jgi:hypothetical protein
VTALGPGPCPRIFPDVGKFRLFCLLGTPGEQSNIAAYSRHQLWGKDFTQKRIRPNVASWDSQGQGNSKNKTVEMAFDFLQFLLNPTIKNHGRLVKGEPGKIFFQSV